MLNFNKRINRVTFIACYLLSTVALVALVAIMFYAGNDGSSSGVVELIYLLLVLFSLVYWLCISRQRANDISGDHPLLWVLVAWLAFFPILAIMPGENKKNKYGPVPKKGIWLP